jgi:hypothetical protein
MASLLVSTPALRRRERFAMGQTHRLEPPEAKDAVVHIIGTENRGL